MTIDEFSKHLIEKTVTELSEKSKCNHTGAGTSCPLHGDADCNSSKQNRAEEFTAEAKNEEGKEKGLDGKACWKGYKKAGTKMKGGKLVDNCVKMKEEKEDESEAEEEKEKKMSKSAKEKHEKAEEKKEKEMKEAKDLPGNQEKIDANKNGKIDAHDFHLLRNKKAKKSIKEMWQKAAEVTEGKKVEIEIMPTVDTPNDPEPPTGRKPNEDTKKKLKKEEVEPLEEKKLSKAEAAKKEKFVKGMKKKFGSFKSKYGERAKEVMYATATKMGKKAA